MRMTFGKHRGKELSDVPDDYPVCALENATSMADTLRVRDRVHLKIGKQQNTAGAAGNSPISPGSFRRGIDASRWNFTPIDGKEITRL